MRPMYMLLCVVLNTCAKEHQTEVEIPLGYSNVVLLDFDGQDVSHTVWNTFYQATYLEPAPYSQEEQKKIYDSVVKYFVGISLQVTTQENDFQKAYSTRRFRIIITATPPLSPAIPLGTVVQNSFIWHLNNPGLIFTKYITSTRTVGIMAANEMGVALGLSGFDPRRLALLCPVVGRE